MFLKNWTTIFLIALLFCSFNVSARPKFWIYTVRNTDTLWDITLKYSHVRYWRKIQRLNNIKQPRQVPPGTKIKIPLQWLNIQNAQLKVIEVEGGPTVRYQNNLPEPVKVGAFLKSGSTLITQEKENALLEFEDDSRILIKENSEVVFDSLLAYNNTGISDSRIFIKHGRTENFVNPNKSNIGTHYQITTPSAVMAVRGTEYRVKVSEDQEVSHSEVLKGKMIAASAGKARLIPEKNGTIVKRGEEPSPPIKLLPAPDLSGMSTLTEVMPVKLVFKTMEKTKAYRIEMAANDNFTTLVFEDISTLPEVNVPSRLSDGHYSVRVRGIDYQDLEGFDAIHQLEVNVLPLPPDRDAAMPTDGTIVREKTPHFTWKPAAKAIAYHFQMSTTPDFTQLTIDKDNLADTEFHSDQIEPGEYYWRMASINNKAEQSSFHEALKLILRPSPKSPAIKINELTEESVSLSWSKGKPGQKYRLQLAEDKDFEDIVEDKEISDAFITLSDLATGKYYVRMATIDIDGYHGEFSPTLTIDIPYSDFGTYYNL